MSFEFNSVNTSSLFTDSKLSEKQEEEQEQKNDNLMNSVFGNTTSLMSENENKKNENKKNENKKNEIIESPESALNEYFKLKNTYEVEIMKNKKKIMNNSTLSNKEKRQEYLKLKPKCINCKRPGGTIFSVKLFSDESKNRKTDYREFRSRCGIISNPCNLNITIQTGLYNFLPDVIKQYENGIKESKDLIIDNKNKLLFGFISTETALQEFDDEKEFIEIYTSLLEENLATYLNIIDNNKKKLELEEDLEKSYELIINIKESIKLYNETENTQNVKDAVEIYINNLQPLFKKIMSLKYSQNLVYFDSDNNTYHLIQNKNTIKSLEYSDFVDKVLHYNVGYQAIQNKKQQSKLIIDSDSSESKIQELQEVQPELEGQELEGQELEGQELEGQELEGPKFILKPSIIEQAQTSNEI
jgi:hypothetical protein